MVIFNSLGSNYSSKFMWQNLFTRGSKSDAAALQTLLAEQYNGTATLTYKGRHALELALRQLELPKDSQVGINGFTCYVVYEAVVNAGYSPVFLDVQPGSLHFGVSQLQIAAGLKAVIIQNTLGFPAPMPEIKKYCETKKVLIIEDLAHSMGAQYADGSEAGTVGDMTMLSFSQDKPLDVVAGGALINRRGGNAQDVNLPLVSWWQRGKNRKYPFLTWVIRSGYSVGVGRYLHTIIKKLHILATPMNDKLVGLHAMSNATAKLVVGQYGQRAQELSHRRQIAEVYQKNLPTELQYEPLGEPSYLRFPLRVDDRTGLITHLKQFQIFIDSTWYDAPVAPVRYMTRTTYNAGDCSEAEEVVRTIINLPTHRHITPEVAQDICAKINQWLQLKK